MRTFYDFMGVMVMCAWIWLVYWHFSAILVSLRDNKVESDVQNEYVCESIFNLQQG